MKAVFYAPMKSPTNPKPSGDRTVARLLVTALQSLGYEVHILEGFKAYCANPPAYGKMRNTLLSRWEEERTQIFCFNPDLWITYHSYYKAPDLIGPWAANEMGMPYVIFEPSFAPKRRGTCWDAQLNDARASFERADCLLPMKTKDVVPLHTLPGAAAKTRLLPPFAPPTNETHPSRWVPQRALLHNHANMAAHPPILLCAAMMRSGKKQKSYRFLAQSLHHLRHLNWHLLIAGDGPKRRSIETAFAGVTHRVTFLGQVPHEQLQQIYSAADLFVWPGLGEAYGMVYLEAAAGGTPSVAVLGDGVREVVKNGRTGTLVEYASTKAYANAIARLLLNSTERRYLGKHAKRFVNTERSFDIAVTQLASLLPTLGEARP